MGNSFDEKAAVWDENPQRLELVEKIWAIIKNEIDFRPIKKVLDYGCGTGLLGYKTVELVERVCFCDTSAGMLEQVKKKRDFYAYSNVDILQSDFVTDAIPNQQFNLILSMMVIHHVTNISHLLKKFNELLDRNGLFCWIDLDQEDGSFHSDNSTIPHFGFSRKEIDDYLKESGFKQIFYSTELFMERESENGLRNFPIFILLAQKA